MTDETKDLSDHIEDVRSAAFRLVAYTDALFLESVRDQREHSNSLQGAIDTTADGWFIRPFEARCYLLGSMFENAYEEDVGEAHEDPCVLATWALLEGFNDRMLRVCDGYDFDDEEEG